jgi:hypothetical protein
MKGGFRNLEHGSGNNTQGSKGFSELVETIRTLGHNSVDQQFAISRASVLKVPDLFRKNKSGTFLLARSDCSINSSPG